MSAIKLHRGHHRIREGHPWIFQNEIESVGAGLQPGDVVTVVDHRGKFVGRGYFNPKSQITVRILTWHDESVDEQWMRARVERAWGYRQRVLDDVDACRVVYSEADGLPGLIVDKFHDLLVIQTLALGIDRWRPALVKALQELIGPRGIYQRNDAPVRRLEGLSEETGWLAGGGDTEVLIRENGLQIQVDVAAGHKTGYFLDQRDNRWAVRRFARGARVLDAFCNTGSFALNAAAAGAESVLGLDASGEALERARRNAAINGLGERCQFVEGNAFDRLRSLVQEKAHFDLVILDPPAFAKNRAALEGALRGYKEINLRALKLLAPGGILVTCSCSQPLTDDLFLGLVRSAAIDAHREVRLIERRGHPYDHPVLLAAEETYYLKCLIFQVW